MLRVPHQPVQVVWPMYGRPPDLHPKNRATFVRVWPRSTEVVTAFRYSTDFRDEVCRRLLGGERVEDLAGEVEVSAQTLYRWKKQALIDAGLKPGVKSFEPDELQRARQRIKDLESELEIVKATSRSL